MTRIAFDFKKSYEEVVLAGKAYKIEFNDETVLRYNKTFDKFYTEAKRLNGIDAAKLSADEQEGMFKELQALVKDLVDELLGKEAYTELYEASGQSLLNMMDLCMYLGEVIGERVQGIQDDRKKKYLGKK